LSNPSVTLSTGTTGEHTRMHVEVGHLTIGQMQSLSAT